MPKRRKKEEENCENCGELLEDCECEMEEDVTIEDVSKVLDVAGKGLDVLTKLKKLAAKNASYGLPPDAMKAHINETKEELEKLQKERLEKEGGKEKKWKTEIRIAIISGIVVPIIIAIIVFLTGFFK